MRRRHPPAIGARGLAVTTLLVVFGSLGTTPAGPPTVWGAEYKLTTLATYEVDPTHHEVRVTIRATFRNITPNPPGRFSVFEVIDLAVHDGARQVRASDRRGRLKATVFRRHGVNVVSVRPRQAVRFRQTTEFKLRYTLPDGASRDVRIRPSVVIFPVWSFGTKGQAVVRVPGDYQVLVDGDPLTAKRKGNEWRLESGGIDDPTRWLALITATLPSSYATFSRSVSLAAGTVELQVRAWSDDRAWGRRTRTLLADALPRLEAEIGLQLPSSGPLVVVESLPAAGGELSEPVAEGTDIAIGFDEPAFTVLHQLAHTWLSPALAEDRWVREGFASRAAAAIAGKLHVDRPFAPAAEARALEDAAFPLVSWGAGGASAAQDRYAYAASWAAANELATAVGADALRLAWQRTAAGLDGYQPVEAEAPPAIAGQPIAPTDSMHLLDQLEAVSGDDLTSIFEEWVFDDATVELLPARHAARDAHDDLLRVAGEWGSPDPVRLALAGWRFGDAEAAIVEATSWLNARDALLNDIEVAGLTAPQRLRDEYQTGGGSPAARAELEAEAAAVATYADALALDTATRSLVEQVGLAGGDQPAAKLAEANVAFAEGDLIGAADLSADALDRLQRAGQDGLVRMASAAVVAVALPVLAISLARRRRRARASGYTARP
ncbi:MAG TPA: hypothetical protein VES36_00170 [Candidatus Limnocylindrales bacterium]|nr:hypothetical protein [Candidatus Limnocylindrales bacterium]